MSPVGCIRRRSGRCSEPATPDPPTTLLAQALTDYNVPNNAAIEASQRHDASLWQKADTGAVLAGDLFSTRAAEVFTQPAESYKVFYEPVQQYGDPPATSPKLDHRSCEGTARSARDDRHADVGEPGTLGERDNHDERAA